MAEFGQETTNHKKLVYLLSTLLRMILLLMQVSLLQALVAVDLKSLEAATRFLLWWLDWARLRSVGKNRRPECYNTSFRRMSITISNWKQICDAPTNNSPSKMAYSFPRSPLTSPDKQNKSQVFYNIESKLSNRATSFGYGNKCDFTKDVPSSPPPNSYNLPSEFSSPQKLKKGFCFGEGRDEMTTTGPLAETINNKNPGPGAYEPLKKSSKIAYSLRGKVKSPQPEAEKVPGPGAYQQNNFFNKTGSIFVSKHANHKAATFNSGGARFRRKENTVPGPGNYDTSAVDFSSFGKYSLSNLQNSKVRSFGHSVRKTFASRCQTPGPGNYTLPSEFGYYASKKQFDRMNSANKSDHRLISMDSP